jgi:hypothetical protein
VLRGGAFDFNLRNVRCAYRGRHVLDYRYWDFGCRVVVHPASEPLRLWALTFWPLGNSEGFSPYHGGPYLYENPSEL